MSAQDSPPLPSRKLAVFRLLSLVTALAGGLFVLGLAEAGMRWRRQQESRADILDPALIRYDELLGWSLNPGAVGGHTNSDFGTTYRIAPSGFRADASLSEPRSLPLHVFVGDSFVFGLGVSEEETFVHLLNTQPGARAQFLNCGIPGFSPDQEALLLERRVLDLKPSVVWLVVYLANDLLDIRKGRAVQVNQPKPYFELQRGQLVLHNNPVPRASEQGEEAAQDLAQAILGEEYVRQSWRASWERRSVLFQILSERCWTAPDVRSAVNSRIPTAIDLFTAILLRMEDRCREHSIQLRLVFMPGRSLIEKPDSIPGQYQAQLLSSLQERKDLARLKPLDLHPVLSASNRLHPGRYFFPNDGHLTREGQRVFAAAIGSAID